MIAIITYDRPHRKTQDLLIRLIDHEVIVIATPFKKRTQHHSLYQHRPPMDTGISTEKLCNKFGFDYINHLHPAEWIRKNNISSAIIGGANILETDQDLKIINSHPGYLPYGRGLDALKWSIYEGYPIGVTTHVINDDIDSGYLIEQKIVPVSYYDTFHSVAYRQYQMEIDMLIKAIDAPVVEKIRTDIGEIHHRMPMKLEPIMMERFNRLRQVKSI